MRRKALKAPLRTDSSSITGTATSTWSSESSPAAPPGNTYGFHAIAPVEAKVNRTVKPLTIALGVFGGVAALAVLLIGLQLISRQLRDAEEESSILRGLGAGPTTIAAESLLGILASIVVGSLLAVAVAVAISPLSPLGPVRPVYPNVGIAFDWSVLAVGLFTLTVGLAAIAVALAFRGAPHRVLRRSRIAPESNSKVAQAAASAGLPPPAVIGVRFALEWGAAEPRFRCVQPC